MDLFIRYIHNFQLPDKAIDLVDQACAMATLHSFSQSAGRGEDSGIGREDIAAAVAERCKISVAQLAGVEQTRLLRIEAPPEERVGGQSQAIKAVADVVRVARSGMKDPNKMTAVLFFVGPTGTGRAEVVKPLAEFLFGSEFIGASRRSAHRVVVRRSNSGETIRRSRRGDWPRIGKKCGIRVDVISSCLYDRHNCAK